MRRVLVVVAVVLLAAGGCTNESRGRGASISPGSAVFNEFRGPLSVGLVLRPPAPLAGQAGTLEVKGRDARGTQVRLAFTTDGARPVVDCDAPAQAPPASVRFQPPGRYTLRVAAVSGPCPGERQDGRSRRVDLTVRIWACADPSVAGEGVAVDARQPCETRRVTPLVPAG